MRTLLFRYGLRRHWSNKFRLVMVLASLALGVGIFVSSFESVIAAQSAITASANAMASKAQWEVSRGHYLGIEESMLAKIRQVPGAIAAPIIEATATTASQPAESLLVVGLDLQSDSTARLFGATANVDPAPFLKLLFSNAAILVAKPLADSYRLSEGSSIALQTSDGIKKFTIAGIVGGDKLSSTVGGNIAIMEIHQAEQAFGTPGLVDRIEVAGVSKAELQRICPGCQIEKPGNLGSAAQDALGRIKSLLGVSVIALLVGVLLIYNAVQVSVLERLQDIAILRAIGTTRVQIFALLLAEWLVIGLVGSCFGIVLGSALAVALVEFTKRTVNTMVPLVADAHVQIGPGLVVAALLIGSLTALAAAFFPVWVAAHVKPLEILRPYSYRRVHRYLPGACIGLALFIFANLLIATNAVSYVLGLAVIGIEFFGIALLFPMVVLTVGKWLRKPMARLSSPSAFLALDGLLKSPHRTAFTMMTFGCALMMTVATEALVGGFRASTGMWMSSAFPFDISVMGNDLASSVYGSQSLPNSLVVKIGEVPGVKSVYSVRKIFTPFRGGDVMAIGIDMDRYIGARADKGMGLWPAELADPRVLAEFKSGKGAFVSTNFAALYHISDGVQIRFDSPSGPVQFTVLGHVDDFSWQHGSFIVDLKTLERLWNDDAVSYIDVSIIPGQSLSQVKARVQAVAAANRSAFAYDKREIREVTDSVLEQAVAMANVQALIGLLIGILGIVNAIWIGVINRRREIALWRAIGVTQYQVRMAIVLEGVFIASVSAVVGCFGGLYGGWVPLRALSFNISGYQYPLVVPWAQIAIEATLALLLGLFAGALPAYQAAKLPILDALGYE